MQVSGTKVCRSFKGHLEKQYNKGHSWTFIHIQLQDEQNPSYPNSNANGFCSCGIEFPVTSYMGSKKCCISNDLMGVKLIWFGNY